MKRDWEELLMGLCASAICLILVFYAAGGSTATLHLGDCTAPIDAPSVLESNGDLIVSIGAELDCGGEVIDPPPLDGECEVLPVGLTRDASVEYALGNDFDTQTGTTYEDIFGPWPLSEAAQSRTYRVEVSRARFLSIPFTVPAEGGSSDRVRFSWEEGLAPSESTVVSVSTCEGGVLESQALPGCHEVGRRAGGNITIGVNAASANCVVERGRSYWLNVADHDEASGETTCDRSVCEWLVRPIAVGAVE